MGVDNEFKTLMTVALALSEKAQTLANAVKAMVPYMPAKVAASARLSVNEIEYQLARVAYLAKKPREEAPKPKVRRIVHTVSLRPQRKPVLD